MAYKVDAEDLVVLEAHYQNYAEQLREWKAFAEAGDFDAVLSVEELTTGIAWTETKIRSIQNAQQKVEV